MRSGGRTCLARAGSGQPQDVSLQNPVRRYQITELSQHARATKRGCCLTSENAACVWNSRCCPGIMSGFGWVKFSALVQRFWGFKSRAFRCKEVEHAETSMSLSCIWFLPCLCFHIMSYVAQRHHEVFFRILRLCHGHGWCPTPSGESRLGCCRVAGSRTKMLLAWLDSLV